MSKRLLGGIGIGIAVLASSIAWWCQPAARALPKTGTGRPKAPGPVLAGTASCSARGCHGALEPVSPTAESPSCFQDEYTRWSARDKHALAFEVLFNSTSRRIANNLNIAKPQEDVRCLACHTNPLAAGPVGAELRNERFFGVGCEACHGSAAKWLDEHTQRGWVKRLKSGQMEKYGWKPLGDPKVRAQVCVGCHVGAPAGPGLPGRDMNHDLIAAGHPRLAFELSSYLANLPPHWNTKGRQPLGGPADWAVGQVCSAEAALELLADRAADNSKPWPEFSEYGCFACHHDLKEPSWRQERGFRDGCPRRFSYATWYLPLARGLLSRQPDSRPALGALNALERTMRMPYPDRTKVAQEARLAAQLLRETAALEKVDRKALCELLLALTAGRGGMEWSWDAAEQLYLAALALEDGALTRPLQELEPIRAFPKSFQSPGNFKPADFRDRLRKILKPDGK